MIISFRKIVILFIILTIIFSIGYILLTKSEKAPEGLVILSGRIEGRQTDIAPKIQGRIIKLYKDEGDRVKSAELLCELDSEQLTARYKNAQESAQSAFYALNVAEANLKKALASYERAKNDFERYSSLLKEELVSKSEFDRIKMQYQSAHAEVDSARESISQVQANYKASMARLNETKADLMETKIYAPADGIILSRPVEVGEVVNPGTVLYVMVDLNKLYVKVYVPEPDIGKIKVGMPARVYIDAYPERFFNGKVTKVYEQAEFTPKNVETKQERVKLVFGVEVSVENPEGLLKPGMPADVVIKWKDNAQWFKPR